MATDKLDDEYREFNLDSAGSMLVIPPGILTAETIDDGTAGPRLLTWLVEERQALLELLRAYERNEQDS